VIAFYANHRCSGVGLRSVKASEWLVVVRGREGGKGRERALYSWGGRGNGLALRLSRWVPSLSGGYLPSP